MAPGSLKKELFLPPEKQRGSFRKIIQRIEKQAIW